MDNSKELLIKGSMAAVVAEDLLAGQDAAVSW